VTRSRKLDLEKIRAALNVTHPHCHAELEPDERIRLDFDHLQWGKCGQTFRTRKSDSGEFKIFPRVLG